MPEPDESEPEDNSGESGEDEGEGQGYEDIWEEGAVVTHQAMMALLHEIKRLGGYPTDLRFILRDMPLRNGIAQGIIDRRREAEQKEELTFEVDYSLPLAQLITNANFDDYDLELVKKSGFHSVRGPKKTLIGRVVSEEKTASLEEMLKMVAKTGFSPADPKALVAFATKFPGLQLQKPIYGLGSIGRDPESKAPVALCITSDPPNKRVLVPEPVIRFQTVDFVLVIKEVEGPSGPEKPNAAEPNNPQEA